MSTNDATEKFDHAGMEFDRSDLWYLRRQLEKLEPSDSYTVQIVDDHGNRTKWLTIPDNMFERVKAEMGELA